MDFLKKYFPLSFRTGDLTAFIITLAIYIVAGAVIGFVIGLLASIPLVGWIVGIIGGLIDLYMLIGMVLAILSFLKVIK